MHSNRFILIALFSLVHFGLGAQSLVLPQFFSDNMVLQRNTDVRIWGIGTENGEVELNLNDEEYKTKCDASGKWVVEIGDHSAGGEYTLHILDATSNASITFLNVTFGDVWLCGGQSNMEWFVENADNGLDEVLAADYPDIRILTIPRKISNTELEDVDKTAWAICSPETIAQFSAVGYFFGRDLYDSLHIPIGLIDDNWGGTVAEAWMSPEAFTGLPVYLSQIEKLRSIDPETEAKSGDDAFNMWIEDFKLKDKGQEAERYTWANLDSYDDWKWMELPSLWESSGDEALADADGVVWFQKWVVLTAEQANGDAEISFGPIDDSDKIWINGKLVGETFNRYNVDRDYTIKAGALKAGRNSIVMRVEDYVGGGGPSGAANKYQIKTASRNVDISGEWHYRIGYLTTEPMPRNAFGPNAYPSMLYFGMIAPLRNYAMKGAIWYQGESNTYRAVEYRDIFRRLILDWRQQFNNPDLAFLFVQLANFMPAPEEPGESTWAELREAQASVLDLPNTAMITTIDIGEADNIHPTNKQEVGRRLALAGLHTAYDKHSVHYEGPEYASKKMDRNAIVIHFDCHGNKLVTRDKYGYVRGFTISGEDQVFHWARAEILDDNHVRVWSDKVSIPVAVRYGWADNPQPADLYDAEGMPAYPFRTDDWPLSTKDIKRN